MDRSRDLDDLVSNNQISTAWCSFNGTLAGTNAPVAGYNVSTVTRTSAGRYTINFTTPMDNINWSVVATSIQANTGDYSGTVARTTNTTTIYSTNNTNAFSDADFVNAHIFGGKT